MARGFKTGGRKPGSKNKRTAERDEALSKAEEALRTLLGDQMFDGDAHALLVAIYKDPLQHLDLRIEAAKAAIRYEKPALASHEVKAETTVKYVARVPQKATNPTTWQQQHAPEATQH